MIYKKILLLGDSIMYGAKGIRGYGYYVWKNLSDRAFVHLPSDNCQDARYLLNYFDDLVEEKNDVYDVIHWNNGLWDVLHFAGNPNPYTPIDVYSKTLEDILALLKQRYPSAKICFATTTPVPEHLQKTSSYRSNSEIVSYNQVALQTLQGKVDFVDDLFSFACTIGDEYRAKDGLHYSEQGAELLSQCVERFVRNIL